MTDNMFQDLIPSQQPQVQANMFGDLIPGYATQQSQPGIIDNIKNDWDARAKEIPEIINALPSQGAGLTGIQLAGQAAGAAGDVIGEGVNAATPRAAVNGAQSLADKIDDTSIGQKMGDAMMNTENYLSDAVKNNPAAGRTATALGNIMALEGGAKGASAIEGTGESLGLGNSLYNSGKLAKEAATNEYIQDLVLPKETPTVKSDMSLRTRQIDGTNIYQPTAEEKQIAATVSSIPGISEKNSNIKNLNLIQDANNAEAQDLKGNLVKNDVKIDLNTIQNGINQSMTTLADHPYVTGDGKTATLNVVKIMNKAILDNANSDGTINASSLLQARKDFDRALPERVFTSPTDTPVVVATRQMRNMANGIIGQSVPSADVAASLAKQSNLYQAADNIAPKAANEASTKMGRMIQKYTPSNLAETGKAAGALIAAKEILPHIPLSVAIPAGISYGAYKGLSNPSTRMILGRMLGSNVP